jgi:hypothetical protein
VHPLSQKLCVKDLPQGFMHHYNEEIWDFQDWLVEDLNQCQGQLNAIFHFSKHQVLERDINASGDARDGGRNGKDGNKDGVDGGSDNLSIPSL